MPGPGVRFASMRKGALFELPARILLGSRAGYGELIQIGTNGPGETWYNRFERVEHPWLESLGICRNRRETNAR